MRRGGTGLIAVVLALAGCKGTEAERAAVDRPVSRDPAQGTGPGWLNGAMAKLPGGGTAVPKADSWADPAAPGFDVASEVRGVLAGRVLDTYGQPAANVFVQIEPVPAPPGRAPGAQIGGYADRDGYFLVKSLEPNRTYNLTVEARLAGKPLRGVVQARTPQPNLTINLRDDLIPAGASEPVPAAPPAVNPGGMVPPPASSDLIPPVVTSPGPRTQPAPRSSDGGWSPGAGAETAPIPATFTPKPPGPPPAEVRPIPPATEVRPTRPQPPVRPENVADGPTPPWKPPAANIPGPPVPTLPNPNPGLPPPAPPVGNNRSSGPVRPGANFALVDTLRRPWEFATNRDGSVVLVEFLTTTCLPCKKQIPNLIDLQSRYGADGLQLVGVVCDDVPEPERAKLAGEYRRDHHLNYALYVEPGPEPGAVRDRFGVESYPTVVLLDGTGERIWQGHPGKKADLESAIRRQLGK